MYVRNSLGVRKRVRTIVIGSMTVRISNAVKNKWLPLDSATHIIVTGPMTTRIGDPAKYKCNTLCSAVHITAELYIFICLQ